MRIISRKVWFVLLCLCCSFASSSWCSVFVHLYYDPKIKKAQKDLDAIIAQRDALFIKVIREKNWGEIQSCCTHNWPNGRDLPYYHGIFEALKAGYGDVAHYLAFGRPGVTEDSVHLLLNMSILFGDRTVFDFLVYYQVNLHRPNPKERNKNAMNYFEEGCVKFGDRYGKGMFYGSPEDREYIRQTLVSRGVTPNVLLPEVSSGEGGCCNVM